MINDFYIDNNTKMIAVGHVWGIKLCDDNNGNDNEIFLDFANKRLVYNTKNAILTDQGFIKQIKNLANINGLGKIWGKCLEKNKTLFEEEGFICEGNIPGFYNGRTAYCMSYFINPHRGKSKNQEKRKTILNKVEGINTEHSLPDISGKYKITIASLKDSEELLKLYSSVFETYPTPLTTKDYIEYLISSNKSLFISILLDNKIISAASAEVDWNSKNAEITDCATLPEHRSQGLMNIAIHHAEKELNKKGIHTFYSLSRAISPGINILFKKKGYSYRGTLVNNCHICGDYEDLNLWVKNNGFN